MTNKGKRFIVLLLSVLMVVSQMTVFSFAANETADDQAATSVEQTQDEAVAFDQSKTVDGVKVTVKADEGVFPAGAELSVRKVAVPKAVDTDDAEAAYAFDISILVDGEEIQPDGKAEVSFETTEVKKYDTEVYHMDGNDPEALEVAESGKTATVEAESFSTYVLVFTVDATVPNSDYSYTMNENQRVPLSTLISGSGFDPTKGYYDTRRLNYNYGQATSSDTSKIAFSGNGDSRYAYVPDDAVFNDAELLTITIPYSFQWRQQNAVQWNTVNENVTIKVNVSTVEGNIVAPTGYDDLVFNGQDQALLKTPGSSTVAGVTFEYKVDDGNMWSEFVGEGPQAKEAGKHTVYWRAMGSNGAVESGEVEVNIAEIEVTAPVAAEGLVYNGKEQIVVAEPASTNATNVTIQYAGTAVNKTAPAATSKKWTSDYREMKTDKAGDFWIWYRVVTDAEEQAEVPNVIVAPAHIDASVDKAECPVVVETVGTLPYTASAQELVRVLNNDDDAFEISYSVNDGAWSTSLPQGTDPGEYSIRWTVAETDNYYGASSEEPVVATIDDYSFVPPTAVEGLVYNGEDQILIEDRATTDIQGATIEYNVTDENAHTPRNGWDSNFRHAAESDAGNYWLWYRVRVGNTTVVGPAHIDAKIDKAECPVEVETVGILSYTGRAQELVRVLNNTTNPRFTVNYSVNDGNWSRTLPQGTEPGEYSIRWNVAETDNYYGASSEEPVVTIIADYIFTEPVADDSLVYNGSAQKLVKEPASIDLDIQGLTIEYASTAVDAQEPNRWTTDYASLTGTNAGDYWIWYRVRYRSGFTTTTIVEPGHITATIKKADCPVEVETTGTLQYSGMPQDLVRVLNNTNLRFNISYSVNDGNWSSNLPRGTEVGSYSIRWKYAGDSNYNPASGTVNTYIVEVDRMYGKATYTEGDNTGVWVYDGEKHGATVKAYVLTGGMFPREVEVTTGVKVYYSLGTLLTADNYNTVGTTSPQSIYPRDAGNYTIYYYIVADDYEPAAGSVDVTINKAYLRISVVDKMTTYGDFVKYNKIKYNEATSEGYIKVEAFKDADYQTEWNYVEGSITNINQFRFDTDGYTNYMSNAGIYYITVEDNLDSDNYIISYESGKLTVTKKQLTFIWSNPQEWDYDGKAHRIDAHIDTKCLVGTDADDESLVTFKYTSDQVGIYTNEATNVLRITDEAQGKDWEVGDYIARIEELRGSRSSNYTIYVLDENGAETDKRVETAQETFRINPVGLTLTPDLLTIPYGDNPYEEPYKSEQTFTPSGLVNNENIDDVLLGTPVEYHYAVSGTTPYKPGDTDVGKYGIEIINIFNTSEDPIHNTTKGLHAQNYEVSANPGVDKLDVVPREIKIVWKDPENLEYDGKYKEVSVVKAENDCTTGFEPEKNSALYGATLSENKKVNAGTYTAVVTLTERAKGNFKILDNSDKHAWTITKRPATIYANSNTIDYGQDPADKGYYVDKKTLVENVETGKLDSIGDVSFNINYRKNGKPGIYSITPVVANLNPNYYIAAYVAGKLTVNDKVTELLAKGKTKGKKAGKLTWNKVSGAASYDVYWSKCNTKKKAYTPKKIATVSGTTYKVKKLKKGVAYKFYIVARDASGKSIAESEMGHFIIGNVMGKYTNPKKITPSKKSVTVAAGGSTKVTTTITKMKKNKKLLNGKHTRKLRYITANPAVATVSQKGTITGVAPGWCRVYAIATDGMWSVIEVNVN